MLPSVRALLGRVIDYAGLFPPAQLPLEEAIGNYARYQQEPESWMLGRFICPAARLVQLRELLPSRPPLPVSALVSGGATVREFLAGLNADLDALLASRRRDAGRLDVQTVEVRLPADLLGLDDQRGLHTVVYAPQTVLARGGLAPLPMFYEVPFGPEWFVKLGLLLSVLAEDPERRKGVKFRCGGAERTAFPSAEDVAFTITACRAARVPLKFTAGLHHPLRHFDSSMAIHVHGFLNVFIAGVLCHAHDLNAAQVRAVLEEEDAKNFGFEERAIGWRSYRAGIAEIEEARRHTVLSFGSCSFDEPRADLRALALLP
jgi:hypothetical protein